MSPVSKFPFLFFFNDTATTEIYTLSLHDALPISIFLLVSAILWLNVLVPAANPFENFYNRFVARRRGRPPRDKAVEIGEHTSELQSQSNLVCRLLLEKKKTTTPSCSISHYQTLAR